MPEQRPGRGAGAGCCVPCSRGSQETLKTAGIVIDNGHSGANVPAFEPTENGESQVIRKALTSTAVLGSAAVIGMLVAATPAHAADTGAYRDNFNGRGCDAQVYVSDTTTSGKVEAFGGFACPSRVKLIGHINVFLFKNGKQVCKNGHGYNLESTAHAQCAVTDSSGSQKWKARIQLVTPDSSGGVSLTTGEIST